MSNTRGPHQIIGFKGIAKKPWGEPYEATLTIMFPLNSPQDQVNDMVQKTVSKFVTDHGGVQNMQQFQRIVNVQHA